MSEGYSRQQQAEQRKRVKIMLENNFAPGVKCVICGRRMSSPDCTHDLEENRKVFFMLSSEILNG